MKIKYIKYIIMTILILSSVVIEQQDIQQNNDQKFFRFEGKNMTTDQFGITKIYETASGGREWFSKWDNGHARTFGSYQDPDDSELTGENGSATYNVDGNGILKISGTTPRLYIIDPQQIKMWHNVEITVYGLKNLNLNIDDTGIITYTRTNHTIDTNYCDTRGYTGRFTWDGKIYLEKETKHGAGYVPTIKKTYWSGGMPTNTWIGYKYVVYDLTDGSGNVKHELYIDDADGLNGGNWVKIYEFTDTGDNWGVGYAACNTGIDPALRLTNSDIRPGSETGKPNLAVYFKSGDVGIGGLWYKKASIREIVSYPIGQLATITISPILANINTGTDQQLAAICKDQAGNMINCPTLAWINSNTTIATVNSNGLVTGISAGTVDITTSSSGITSNVSTIKVSTPIINSIQIGLSIKIGTTKQLTVKCKDQNDNTITCPTLKWTSSNTAVVTVSSSGIVKGITKGMANITASNSGMMSNIFIITVTY